ncbi:MAG: 4-hydroxy-tetrahydrodipicolinate reductase [Bacteroidota bacterium]|nr:4-hydroxy-tetrahydrodipicolinate reductase [Bacteroidota bacterium]
MKIAILGNGKMGKKISELATKKGYNIVCISDSNTPAKSLDLSIADVAIDFSTPTTAFENIAHAINSGIPVISGTTAWLDKLQNINDLCTTKGGAFLYASNFSLGVNILFDLNKKLATLMKNKNYESKIHEIHHTQKLDSPSGTAITLAEQMNEILKNKTTITSNRIDDTPGTHQITYSSKIDKIEIKHTANNRNGFAMGALMAAEWIIGKKGIYSMQDVLTQ